MNPLAIVALVNQLIPMANTLITTLDLIKTQHPDVWAQVSAEYNAALENLRTTVPKA